MLHAQGANADGTVIPAAMLNVGRSLGDEPFAWPWSGRRGQPAIKEIKRAMALGEPSEPALSKVQSAIVGLDHPMLQEWGSASSIL